MSQENLRKGKPFEKESNGPKDSLIHLMERKRKKEERSFTESRKAGFKKRCHSSSSFLENGPIQTNDDDDDDDEKHREKRKEKQQSDYGERKTQQPQDKNSSSDNEKDSLKTFNKEIGMRIVPFRLCSTILKDHDQQKKLHKTLTECLSCLNKTAGRCVRALAVSPLRPESADHQEDANQTWRVIEARFEWHSPDLGQGELLQCASQIIQSFCSMATTTTTTTTAAAAAAENNKPDSQIIPVSCHPVFSDLNGPPSIGRKGLGTSVVIRFFLLHHHQKKPFPKTLPISTPGQNDDQTILSLFDPGKAIASGIRAKMMARNHLKEEKTK